MKDKIIKVIGLILMLLSFYYIYLSLKKSEINWEVLSPLLNGHSFIFMVISFLLYLIVLYISSAFWSYLVQSFSDKKYSKRSELMVVYAKSNIAKYLPGNFMQFVGRNILAHKLGYKHSDIFLSTLYDILYVLISGVFLLVFISTLSLDNIPFINNISIPNNVFLLLAATILVFAIIVLATFKSQVIQFIQKYKFVERTKGSFLIGIFVYVLIFLILGLANLILLNLFASQFSLLDYYNILFVFVISWLIGFIIPGAPGGIGIREAGFILLLSQNYQIMVVTLIPILFRIINIIGDVCFFVLNFRRIKSDY